MTTETTTTTTVWQHLKNWKSVYFLAPLAFFFIWLFAKLAYLITGYRPTANGDWIPEAAGNAVKFVLAIVILEFVIEQTGHWYTKDEVMKNPHILWSNALTRCVIFALVVYGFWH